MADPTKQSLQDVTSLLKGSLSTSKIFMTLFVTSNKIPRNVSVETPSLKQAVALNVEANRLSNKLKEGGSETRALAHDIETYLQTLGNFKSTIGLQEAFEKEFAPKKTKFASMVNERTSLLGQLTKLIVDQQAKMSEIFTRLSKKDITETQARHQVKDLRKSQEAITSPSEKLALADKSMQAELVDLRTRTKAAADVIASPTSQQATPRGPGLN